MNQSLRSLAALEFSNPTHPMHSADSPPRPRMRDEATGRRRRAPTTSLALQALSPEECHAAIRLLFTSASLEMLSRGANRNPHRPCDGG